jgi:hypothetical protein
MNNPQKLNNNSWRFFKNKNLIEFTIQNNIFSFYDGPEDPMARTHEGGGGQIPLEKIRDSSLIQSKYPELIEWIQENDFTHK